MSNDGRHTNSLEFMPGARDFTVDKLELRHAGRDLYDMRRTSVTHHHEPSSTFNFTTHAEQGTVFNGTFNGNHFNSSHSVRNAGNRQPHQKPPLRPPSPYHLPGTVTMPTCGGYTLQRSHLEPHPRYPSLCSQMEPPRGYMSQPRPTPRAMPVGWVPQAMPFTSPDPWLYHPEYTERERAFWRHREPSGYDGKFNPGSVSSMSHRPTHSSSLHCAPLY